ncbi:TGBp1 family protein [Nocardia arizonensis]|uniref:TGBp1 family protein n=1 Tax=Nocardia arizonensis TaxID=1141647 RepID=UPI000AD65932|nr:TGBp1 family protein [Nocardia arizonensis]
MSPPLNALSADSDALSAESTEPRIPAAPERIMRPTAVHDLRGDPVDELRYPATAALVVAGVPGAGKSTALSKFFGARPEDENPSAANGALVLDSHQARNRWRHRLGRLPYPLWRPVVHVVHYAAVKTALRDTRGPVVIHDCATFGWVRTMIGRWAAGCGREVHLVMLDVPATDAMAGQRARGRRVNGVSFRLHVRRWRRLMGSPARLGPTPVSVVLVDRPAVNAIRRITFAG